MSTEEQQAQTAERDRQRMAVLETLYDLTHAREHQPIDRDEIGVHSRLQASVDDDDETPGARDTASACDWLAGEGYVTFARRAASRGRKAVVNRRTVMITHQGIVLVEKRRRGA